MINSITTWMGNLSRIAKEKGTKIEYRFAFWEHYFNEGFTPLEAIEEESKKRKIESIQNIREHF